MRMLRGWRSCRWLWRWKGVSLGVTAGLTSGGAVSCAFDCGSLSPRRSSETFRSCRAGRWEGEGLVSGAKAGEAWAGKSGMMEARGGEGKGKKNKKICTVVCLGQEKQEGPGCREEGRWEDGSGNC